jgi:hypothetical protein
VVTAGPGTDEGHLHPGGLTLLEAETSVSVPSPLLVTLGSVSKPLGGLQIRARVTAEVFSAIGCDTSVVSTFEPDAPDSSGWARKVRYPRRNASVGFSPELVKLIRESLGSSSVMVMTHATLLPAIILAGTKVPIIWDTNECHSLHYRRLPRTAVNRAKYYVWLGLERWASRRCWRAIAIGDVEARTWVSTHPVLAGKLAVVDHAALSLDRDPVMSRKLLEERIGRPAPGPVLLFLGTLAAKQNVAAAKWIVEDLSGGLSADVTIVLCGPGSDKLPVAEGAGAKVVGLGAVEDVDSVIAAADLCLAPLAAGAGVKTKVLHYLAHGKRVVGTPIAFEGLEGAPGLYEATLTQFREEVLGLCVAPEPPDAAQRRVEGQKRWLDEHHGRARLAEQWRSVFACLPS